MSSAQGTSNLTAGNFSPPVVTLEDVPEAGTPAQAATALLLIGSYGPPVADGGAVSHRHDILRNSDGSWGWTLYRARVPGEERRTRIVGAAHIFVDGSIAWIRHPE